MDREGASVRLLQTLPGLGIQQFVRLALCSPSCSEAMAGQYCVLSGRTECWPCSYVTLPGVAGQFIVSTQSAQPLGRAGNCSTIPGRLAALGRCPCKVQGCWPSVAPMACCPCWVRWMRFAVGCPGYNCSCHMTALQLNCCQTIVEPGCRYCRVTAAVAGGKPGAC